jgi:hypothetical protein
MAIFVGRFQDQMVGRDIDRRQSAGETAAPGARTVYMAFRGSVLELQHGIGAVPGIVPQSQQHIIVAVENRLHPENPALPDIRNGKTIFVRLVKNGC